MASKVVAIAKLPWRGADNPRRLSNLEYARFSELTWRWWCKNKAVEFTLVDQPLGGPEFHTLPPTIQRWLALEHLFSEFGRDAQIALADADTMIRWDTPDFFEIAGGQFAAVKDWYAPWAFESINAYQHFFPEVHIPWWEYFNTGLVLMTNEHVRVTRALTKFFLAHDAEIVKISNPWGYGDDQTLLNFIVRQQDVPVLFLEPTYNVLHCVPATAEIARLEQMQDPPADESVPALFGAPPAFIQMGYIWHFTNVSKSRGLVMKEVWKHICHHYPGAVL